MNESEYNVKKNHHDNIEEPLTVQVDDECSSKALDKLKIRECRPAAPWASLLRPRDSYRESNDEVYKTYYAFDRHEIILYILFSGCSLNNSMFGVRHSIFILADHFTIPCSIFDISSPD